MPIYEYQCLQCHHKFEKQMSMEAMRKEEVCPECGGKSLRIMSVVHSSFGWRLTEASHERFAKDEFERDI